MAVFLTLFSGYSLIFSDILGPKVPIIRPKTGITHGKSRNTPMCTTLAFLTGNLTTLLVLRGFGQFPEVQNGEKKV